MASVTLVSPGVVTVKEEDDQNEGSSVEICLQLVVNPNIPVDRPVIISLDTNDMSTGTNTLTHYITKLTLADS